MLKVIFDCSKIATEDVQRFMKYGMGYVATMDYFIDNDDLNDDERTDEYTDEYIKNIRPAILQSVKDISTTLLKEMDNGKSKVSINLKSDTMYFAFVGLYHHLDSNIEFYKAKNINMLGVPMDQVQKDFKYIESRLKALQEAIENDCSE